MMEEKKKDHLIIMILKASVTNLPVHRDGCLRYEFQFTMYPLNTFRPLFMDGELIASKEIVKYMSLLSTNE